jgi:Tfp pilus assembly protein PilF
MDKRLLSAIIAAFVLAVVLAVPAHAQFGAIEGDVKGVDGKPSAGIQVVITRTDIKGEYKTKSDKKGHYYHGGLPLGTFTVKLMDGDKVLDLVQNVRVRPGDPIPINFDLQGRQQMAMAAAAGVKVTQTPEGPRLSKEQMAKIEEEAKKKAAERAKFEKLNTKFKTGMDALAAKNCDVAAADLKEAAETDPTQHVVQANLAEAYVCLSKTKSGEERTTLLKSAVEAYKKAIELKGDDASYHNNYGLALVQAGQLDEGKAELTKATQLDPTQAAKFYYNLGAVLTNTGKVDEAAEAFRQAIASDPNFADAQYQLGIALMGKVQFDAKTGKSTPAPGTIEAFQKYLELQPAGANAETAKQMIATLGGTLQTEIKSERPKAAPKKKQ